MTAARAIVALAAALASCRSDMSQAPGSRAPDGEGAAPVGAPAGEAGEAGEATPADEATPAAKGDPEEGRLAGITAAHNIARSELDLPPLAWSPELAAFAAAWADTLQRGGCDLQHRPRSGPDAQRYGENIFSGSGFAPTAAQVVDAWVAERKDYDAKTGRCRGVCGHYTQVVWRKSQRVGCAMAACGETEVWVCNYDPPGNFMGQAAF